jgi:parallel beta-helix repeat protein
MVFLSKFKVNEKRIKMLIKGRSCMKQKMEKKGINIYFTLIACILCALVFLPWVAPERACAQITVYVDNTPSCSNDASTCGAVGDPCCTIQQAITRTKGNGSTAAEILVSEGSYAGFHVDRDNLVIKAEDGEGNKPEITTGFIVPGPFFLASLDIYVNASNVTIDGFNITGNASGTWHVGIYVSADNNTAIEFITLTNNYIEPSGGYPKYGIGLDAYPLGVILGGGTLDNINVENNTITGNTAGIHIWSNFQGIKINNNFIFNNLAGLFHGSYTAACGNIDVTGNWWGDASGPSGGVVDQCMASITAAGSGDMITRSRYRPEGRFCFSPWCTDDGCTTSSDNDGDGYIDDAYSASGGDDCDDGNAAINPGATEECDGIDNNCDGYIDEGCPTLIELSSFTASPESGKVILAWITESEINNAGFNLYRAESVDGEYIKINESLIPAEGSPTEGAYYIFIDDDVKNRKTYYYILEDVDLNGTKTNHGSAGATPRLLYWLEK